MHVVYENLLHKLLINYEIYTLFLILHQLNYWLHFRSSRSSDTGCRWSSWWHLCVDVCQQVQSGCPTSPPIYWHDSELLKIKINTFLLIVLLRGKKENRNYTFSILQIIALLITSYLKWHAFKYDLSQQDPTHLLLGLDSHLQNFY